MTGLLLEVEEISDDCMDLEIGSQSELNNSGVDSCTTGPSNLVFSEIYDGRNCLSLSS